MKIYYLLIVSLILFAGNAFAQTTNVFYIGHSVCGTTMPNMVDDIAIDAGFGHNYDHQLMWGACLSMNWDNHDGPSVVGSDSWVELATGNYDVVTLIEQIPLTEVINTSPWGCNYTTAEVGGWFYDVAIDGNPNTQVYMVEVWTEFDRTTSTTYVDWKAANDAQLVLYENVVDEINLQHEGPDMCLMPVRLALQALTDSIEAGSVPGLTSWLELFYLNDPLEFTGHLSEIGDYFSALVYYATIYKSNPVGLTNQTIGENGYGYDAPLPETALKMQEIAWDVVTNYSRSCVETLTGVEEFEDVQNTISLYPNPTSNRVTIENSAFNGQIYEVSIFNNLGQTVYRSDVDSEEIELDLSGFSKGVLWVKITSNKGNILKKLVHQ